jgi:hypothetical protein
MTKIVFFILFFFTFSIPSFSQQFSSQHYIINMGNFNMTSGYKTSNTFRLTDTVGQNAPGIFENNGVTLKSGFQYIYDTFYQFSFAVDTLDIDFGTLVANVATTAVSTLTLSTPSGNGYQITSQANQPLTNIYGSTIPDTVCDDGNCTESVYSDWINPTTHGFGFNASGIGTSIYFASNNSYRQFADSNQLETPQILAAENSPVTNRQTIITYKINIPSNQSAGTYHNYLTYTATPKY